MAFDQEIKCDYDSNSERSIAYKLEFDALDCARSWFVFYRAGTSISRLDIRISGRIFPVPGHNQYRLPVRKLRRRGVIYEIKW